MVDEKAARLWWTSAVALLASLLHWTHLTPWVPLLLCLCLAWRLAVVTLGWRLPRPMWRRVLALAAFLGVLFQYRTFNGVQAGSALLTVMIAMKVMETDSRRDQLVLMITSYFLLFAGFLISQSIISIAYLVAVVWVTTIGLLQLSRRGRLLPVRDTVRISGQLLLQAVPIMLVLFILFPRLPGPLWALPSQSNSATSGLSNSMSPGDITDLGLSDAVAFRVIFEGRPPPPHELYWRGPVLTHFNGRTWSQPRGPGRFGLRRTLSYEGQPVKYRIKLEPHGQNWLLALDMPSAWPEREGIMLDSHYQLKRIQPIRNRVDFNLTSYSKFVAAEQLSSTQLELYTRLPPDRNPRTRALVNGWLGEGASPTQIIARALNYFRAQPFYYTLTPPPANTNHTADEFLFDDREGFCEHYASAFSILMRAAGIPARVVTGYQGGELNPLGEYYIIRQSDAHAWVELWLGDQGWVRVDPTAAVAPLRIQFGLDGSMGLGEPVPGRMLQRFPLLGKAVLVWDAVNSYWSEWILGYDMYIQRDLMEWLGLDDPRWATLLFMAGLSTGVLLVLLTFYLAWRFKPKSLDTASRWYARGCAKLKRVALLKSPHEGPMDFAQRVAAAQPELAGPINEITRLYVKARYEGGIGLQELERLRQQVRAFKPLSV
jgi:transglutaminase-like putative cysteine protease